MNLDTGPLEEDTLLDHIGFVRKVAARLAAPDQVDDVVQSALVIALTRPPRRIDGLRRWLARVVRSVVRQEQRSTDRRQQRELRAPPPAGSPSPQEAVAQLQAHRQVVSAVLELDEPYRSTVFLRFFHGLSIPEIAARRDEPEATVETRLRRALQRLRERYVARHGQDSLAILALVARLPLHIVQGTGVAAAASVVATATPSSLANTLFAGAWTMAAFVKAGAAVTVVAIGLWFGLRDPNAPSGQNADRRNDDAVADAIAENEAPDSETIPAAVPMRQADTLQRTEAETPSLVPALKHVLEGRLVGLDSSIAWTRPIEVHAWFDEQQFGWPRFQTDPALPCCLVQVLPDGSFHADLAELLRKRQPQRLQVIADDPNYVRAQATLVMPNRAASKDGTRLQIPVEIAVRAAARVEGFVVNDSGQPIPSAHVALIAEPPKGDVDPVPEDATNVDPDGAFRLRSARSGTALLVATLKPGPDGRVVSRLNALPTTAVVELAVGQITSVGDLVLDSGASIRGRATATGGAPLSHARVLAIRPGGSHYRTGVAWDERQGRFASRSMVAETNELGDFEFLGLEAQQDYDLCVLEIGQGKVLPLWKSGPERTRVPAPSEDVELRCTAACVVLEITSEGIPVYRATVHVQYEGGTVQAFNPGWSELRDGQAALYVPELCPISVSVSADGFKDWRLETLAPHAGTETRIAVELDREEPVGEPLLRLRITDPWGGIVTRAGFQFQHGDHVSNNLNLLARDGWFLFQEAKPGPTTLRIRPGDLFHAGEGLFLEEQLEVVVPESGTESVSLLARPGGRVRVRVCNTEGSALEAGLRILDDSGSPLEIAVTHREEYQGQVVGISRHDVHTTTEGPNLIDPALPGGNYTLETHCPGFQTSTLPFTIEPGRVLDLRVVLERE